MIARSVFRYWSTGSTKLTPKSRELKALHGPCLTQSASASCRLVAKKLVCQIAEKPWAPTLRSLGRNSPMKLGCGQGELISTRESRPTGVMLRLEVPFSLRSKAKSRLCGTPTCKGASGTCTPPLSRRSPLPGWKSRDWPFRRSFSALPIPRISLMPTARKGCSKR
ncbi:hypothetical protein FQZ97_1068510 [compost metagenome]